MALTRHEDIVAWQLARQVERRVFAFTAKLPAKKDFDFCRQIRKSSSSAPRNMAEGFGRFWPAEFAHKLRIAIGELKETQDHLVKAMESGYVSQPDYEKMFRLADRSIGAAVRFVAYLEAHGEEWKKAYRARKRRRATRTSDGDDRGIENP